MMNVLEKSLDNVLGMGGFTSRRLRAYAGSSLAAERKSNQEVRDAAAVIKGGIVTQATGTKSSLFFVLARHDHMTESDTTLDETTINQRCYFEFCPQSSRCTAEQAFNKL